MATLARERVLVVDDDEAGRDLLIESLRDFDFEPLSIDGAYGTDIDKMLEDIEGLRPEFVICDHKLQSKGLASFFGSDVVQRLKLAKIPAMLLTMYESTDWLRLREIRDQMPVVLGRDDFKIEDMPSYIHVCSMEVANQPVKTRLPHRVIIRIDEIPEDAIPERVHVVVSSWSPDHAVAIPRSCFSADVSEELRPGMHLLGDVNIGALTEDELFLKNINEIVETTIEL